MKKKLFFLLSVLLLQTASYACGGLSQVVYSGEITYTQSPVNPLTYTAIFTLDFDILDSLPTDSILVNWGDDQITSVFAISSRVDTAAKNFLGYERYFTHVYEGTHTYDSFPASGQFIISVTAQYRMSEVTNFSTGGQSPPFYIEAVITADTTQGFVNHPPVINLTTVGLTTLGNTFYDNLYPYDPDGDSIVFDIITPLLEHEVPVFNYYNPESYCQILGETSPYTFDRSTGSISWANPCGQGIFTIATIVREYRNGHLLSSSVRDKNIFVAEHHGTGITDVANNPVQIFPNPASSFIQIKTEHPITISITNVLGETIRKQNIDSSTTIDIAYLHSGIYFVTDESHSFTAKFVKE